MRPWLASLALLAATHTPALGDETLDGRVLGPDGRPASGTSVALVEPGRPLDLPDGRLGPETPAPHAEADAEGRFRLPRPSGRFAVLALDDRGVAVGAFDDHARPVELTLRPWGRVAGAVRIGDRPDAGRPVVLLNAWSEGDLSVGGARKVGADAEGRFAFDRVLPGLTTLGRERAGMISDLRWLDVGPGAAVEATVGGVGRAVEGRLAYPEGTKAPAFDEGRANLSPVLPPIPFPPEWAAWPAELRLAWRRAWDRTPEGAAYMRSQDRHVAEVAPDGTFRVEDVPTGRYTLSVLLQRRLPEAPPDSAPRVVAQDRREVEVTPGDGPLELGPVEPTVASRAPEVGEPAPEFAVATLDGRPLRLADLRGKYVLLDFWATWCGPCAEELPHLKATAAAFGEGPRFALVGLSLDDEPGPARRFAEDRGMAWTQGFLGPWANSDVAAAFDVQAIPSIWLIGPDGRVVARDLHGEAIRAAVAEALGRP